MKNNKLIAEFMGHPTMIWNDPDPIEGNDYRVVYFKQLCDKTALIQYGKGEYNSEAEVFLTELEDIELEYHTSWDWLMPVVESMESMGYNVSIMRRCWVVVFDTNVMKEIVSIERRASKLEVTYEAVVEFIKQYNENERLNNEYISHNDAPYGQD